MRPHEVARRIVVAINRDADARVETVLWLGTDLFRVDMKNGEQFEVLVSKVDQ